MKKILMLIFIISMSLSSISQEKVFKGIIFDQYTHHRIKDVTITPYFNNTKVISDTNGRIEIILDRKYKDTLVFNHPNYYPFIKRVNSNSNLKLNFIELIPRSFIIDTICYVAYKENRLLSGEITDTYRSEPLKGAVISLENEQVISYSNKNGVFKVAVPRSAKEIIVSHEDFKTKIIPIKYEKKYVGKVIVNMDRTNFQKDDTLWKSYKHIIEVTPLELAIGSIGIKYQHFTSVKYCFGLQTSTYFSGIGYGINMPSSKFTGFKFAPFFRYYESRLKRKSSFLEVKLISGYFDFSELYYSWKEDSRNGVFISENFWSFGIGAGLGWSSIFPHSKHMIITISAGVQYFPMHVPDSIESDNFGKLNVNKLWWYIGGPGSAVVVNIAIGGIF